MLLMVLGVTDWRSVRPCPHRRPPRGGASLERLLQLGTAMNGKEAVEVLEAHAPSSGSSSAGRCRASTTALATCPFNLGSRRSHDPHSGHGTSGGSPFNWMLQPWHLSPA